MRAPCVAARSPPPTRALRNMNVERGERDHENFCRDDADSDATIEVEEGDEQNDDVNINNEAPMEINAEFFEYADAIFQQLDDQETLKQKMSCQIKKVEADSTTWSLADGVLVDDVFGDGSIQLNHIFTTLDEGEIEFNWDNGRYMPVIVDGDDDADSDATIDVEKGSDDGAEEPNDDGTDSDATIQMEEGSEDSDDDNINDESINDDFFDYVNEIFRQFDYGELD
ncbi:hypothetical protein JTB14_026877 [Gonioctena quinquepunctata]|nr:hypothetical protein JTB14_026877 [Gonioctena quinquepunctata]